jgi:hypothetical protein
MFFSEVGPQFGPFLRRNVNGKVISVIGSPAPGTSIGRARPCGWDAEGAQLWKLTVHGEELPGRWIVLDREFRPAR